MKVIAAVLLSTFVFGSAIAQTPSAAMTNADAKRDLAVEKHIKELHATLRITPAEETQWSDVAATMRENAKDLDGAIDRRVANKATASAVDDLNAYADIAQTHANGVKKLAGAFSGLYAVMSDGQKKEADEVFGHRGHYAKVAKQ
jgi:periplasmic protein CpxP/Spy